MLHAANNPKIMGLYLNNRISNISGIVILLLMLATLKALLYFSFVK